LADGVSDERLAKSVWALLGNAARQREMRAAGLMTIDGQGASRVACDIAKALVAHRAAKPAKIAR
jgi:spore coat polysaccharide biosynthesis protein SpsF